MNDNVGDSVVIKLPEVLRQLNMPCANSAGTLEGKITLVAEVELEESTVILTTARGNGLDSAQIVIEAIVVEISRPGILRAGRRFFTHAVALQGESSTHAGIGASNAGDCETDRFDPAEIVARVVNQDWVRFQR